MQQEFVQQVTPCSDCEYNMVSQCNDPLYYMQESKNSIAENQVQTYRSYLLLNHIFDYNSEGFTLSYALLK